MPDTREAFEKWAIDNRLAYRDEHGHGFCWYSVTPATVRAAWQASREQALEEAAAVCVDRHEDNMADDIRALKERG